MYRFLAERLEGWQIPTLDMRRDSASPERVGYYVWHFPALSETFIQREVLALKRAGLPVLVFAEAPEDVELLDGDGRVLLQETHYLLPTDESRLRRYRRRLFSKSPLRYLNLLLYTVGRQHSAWKNPERDLQVFNRAVYLAGSLQDQQLSHLHSPWANLSAFIALLASRLAGIPYSVQARASADLYRTRTRMALTEKFENARFVLTNARFNQAFIELYLPPHTRVPVHTVYEGLDLARFPPRTSYALRQPVRILTVARLIEEKGLVYLLRALKLLQDRGCAFRCEIVGAPVEPAYADYNAELKALWSKLELEDAVAFLGALSFDRVLAKYERADIFVLPCVPAKNGGRDVTPNALMEAMAMGLPVISTNMSGIPEMVEHGVSGLLVPPKNAPALAEALTCLIADPELRARLGQNARARVQAQFDIDTNMLQVAALFRGKQTA